MHSYFIPLHEFKEGLFLLRPHECISHNNNADILHSIDSEFRNKDHVVLLEREGTTKILFKKFDSNFNCAEPFLRLSQL
jgi:DNA-binding cell septation regulator SpoVG